MSERFIVTGGAGFIGSNVVQALNSQGHTNIIVVDHMEPLDHSKNLPRLRFAEYLDRKEFRTLLLNDRIPKVNGVFHLGACSATTEANEVYLQDNNYQFTQDLCKWSLRTDARFVYASSAATYGDGSQGFCDEDSVTPHLKPLNLYGHSKQNFDLWALRTGAIGQIAGLKYFNVYGPGEDHKGDMRSVVGKAYLHVKKEGSITLFQSHHPNFRDGEQTRDFLYVSDAVAVTLFFYDHPHISGLFNCGTGTARTWIDLAKALFAAMGIPPQIYFCPIPESIRAKYQYHTEADMTKLRKAGFTAPFLTIEEGVRRYVKDYLEERTQTPSL